MMNSGPMDSEQIRQRAFELWEQDGCPEGRDVEYWLRAEAELAGEVASGLEAPPAAGAGSDVPAVASEPDIVPLDKGGTTRTPRARAASKAAGANKPASPGSDAPAEERGEPVQPRRARKKTEG